MADDWHYASLRVQYVPEREMQMLMQVYQTRAQHVAMRVYGRIQLRSLASIQGSVDMQVSIAVAGSGGTGATVCKA